MTMLRIGCMNLMLHGIDSPNFRYADTLSKGFDEERLYDVVLANPPFKGAIDAADVNPSLPAKCKKTEILFLHLFLRLLENGGRAAVIVPDGVLFGSSRAHEEIAPLKADRLEHHATIHRLRFEEVIADDGNAEKARMARERAEAELADLQAKIAPLQQEINQLGRQFWVSKDQVKANNYDLSASRYRHLEQEEVFYELPEVTLRRMRELEKFADESLASLQTLLGE